MIASQIPRPTRTDSFESYAIRTHAALSKAGMQDPDRRNEIVNQHWSAVRGMTPAEQVSRSSFSPQQFHKRPQVCIFAEHETTDREGKPRKYGLRELVSIVRECNDRATDKAFAGLSEYHTPDPELEPNKPSPGLLGYYGAYRLGMIGRANPRWAIFADEYQLREAVPTLRKRPRRSVELWTYKDGKQFFDPIASLGAEAPRLPLPVKFSSFHRDGAVVERYSMEAPASYPGGGSTHVKKFQAGAQQMALAQEDIAAILDALSQTPQFQFLDSQMQQAQGPAAGGEELFAAGPEEPPIEAAPELGAPGEEGLPAPPAEEDDLEALLAGVGEEEEPMAYSAAGQGEKPEKYQAAYKKMLGDHAKLRQAVVSLKRDKTDAQRKERLGRLVQDHPAVDFDQEAKACLYSMGSTLDDKGFDAHVATVERYAQQFGQATPMLPGGENHRAAPVGVGGITPDAKYEARLSEAAVRIATSHAERNEPISWAQAENMARKELQPA